MAGSSTISSLLEKMQEGNPHVTRFYEVKTSGELLVTNLSLCFEDILNTKAKKIGRFPVQTPLGAWPGLGTQTRYEAPGDLRVKNVKRSD